ncbi:hypothetical protein GGX14DRAFT_428280 [Mycena pura]|uniref:Uncharacterized protein n=1 Tax=Mycena pura TaxID=153505 RepID=A0AAD6VTF2_9AGAR|nr:hypothetical protein GGX14DRAFT_428280 [Mycena pura]
MPLSLTPALAAFVVVVIDPVATVAALKDPLATAAATKMVPRKYVGYVSRAIDVFDWKAPYHTYAIQFTSPVPADICMPVSPQAAPRLGGHQALRTTMPLPWAAAHQPSCMCSTVRVPVRLEDHSAATFLTPTDVMRHRRILADDMALLRRAGSADFDLCDLECDGLNLAHVSEEQDVDMAMEIQLPDTKIVVDLSYDLSELDELPDPSGFFEEKRQLQELVAKSISRKDECVVEISTEPVAVVEDVPVRLMDSQEAKPLTRIDPKTPYQWSRREHLSISGYLFNIGVLLSVVGEVAARTERLSAALMHMEEEGVKFLQRWSGTVPVRFG